MSPRLVQRRGRLAQLPLLCCRSAQVAMIDGYPRRCLVWYHWHARCTVTCLVLDAMQACTPRRGASPPRHVRECALLGSIHRFRTRRHARIAPAGSTPHSAALAARHVRLVRTAVHRRRRQLARVAAHQWQVRVVEESGKIGSCVSLRRFRGSSSRVIKPLIGNCLVRESRARVDEAVAQGIGV